MKRMIRRVVATGVLVSTVFALLLPVAANAQVTSRGLMIAPLRQEMTLRKEQTGSGTFTVGNYTDKPMTIELSVKQFSVRDYSYDYMFKDPTDKWVQLEPTKLKLAPDEKRDIAYTVTVPALATPGGHYFTMIASTKSTNGGLPVTLQAATLLYLTTDGTLTRDSSLEVAHIPSVVFRPQVPYEFDVRSKGNVHFTATFFAKTSEGTTSEEHIVLPGTVRRISGEVTLPVLPGVYTVTYGYTVAGSEMQTTKTARVLYVPPWFILAIALGLGIAGWALTHHRKKRSKKPQKPPVSTD